MRKTIIFLFAFALLISSAYAFGETKTFVKSDIEKDFGSIDIYSYWKLPLISDKLSSYKLLDNGDSVIDAWAYGTTTLYTDSFLFSNIEFASKLKTLENVSYVIYYQVEEPYTIEQATEKTICEENLSIKDEVGLKGEIIISKNKTYCYQVIDKIIYVNKTRSVMKPYKGEKLKEGTYYWKIEAKKPRPNYALDWIVEAEGIKLDEWAWWSSSWSKKKEIKIQERTGNNWNNYSVYINVTYDSDMNANFSDLRFIDGSETTELKYYIESKIDSNSALIWVKTNLTGNVNTSIYMYYGNAGVATTSNQTTAFLWDDDGSRDRTSEYTLTGSTATWSWSSGAYTLDASAGLTVTAYPTGFNYGNYTITTELKDTSVAYACGMTMRLSNSDGNSAYKIQKVNTNINARKGDTDITAVGTASAGVYFNATIWGYGSTVNWSGQGNTAGSYQATDTTYSTGYGGFWSYNEGNGCLFKRLRIRAYSTSEPTYVFGAETGADSITIQNNIPLNDSNFSSLTVNFNCNASTTGNNISSFNLSVYNSTSAVFSNKTNSLNNATYNMSWNSVTLPRDGVYYWNCSVSSVTGSNATSSTRTLNIDSTSPVVTINYPTATTYNYNITNITWSITHPAGAVSSCWFTNNSGATNITVNCANNISFQNSSEGSNTWKLYSNDTFNNVGSATVAFVVNTASHGVIVQLNEPVTNTYTSSSTLTFYYGIIPIQSNISNSTFYLYNPDGSVFISDISPEGNVNTTANTTSLVTSMPEGILKWNVKACYRDNVLSSYNCTYSVNNNTLITDYNAPIISIVTPTATSYSTATIPLNYTVTDTNLNSCWYSMNGGASNTSLTCGVNVSSLSVAQGYNTVTLYVNDSANNKATTSRSFFIDTQAPSLYYGTLTPANSTNQTKTNIVVDLNVNDISETNLSVFLYNSSKVLIASNSSSNNFNGSCFQETANESSSCGGLSTGSYLVTGSGATNYGVFFDKDYSTNIDVTPAFNGATNIYMNYTIPVNAINALWSVKHGTFSTTTHENLTIPSSCMANNKLQLKYNISCYGTISCINTEYAQCYNYSGNNWIKLTVGDNAGSKFFEEAVIWNLNGSGYQVTNFTGLTDGTYHFNATATDINGLKNYTETRFIDIDTTKPSINITAPIGDLGYFLGILPLSLNYTINDTHISSCWFDYNNVNTTLDCTKQNVTFTTYSGKTSLIVYANDTFGNINSYNVSWYYSILDNGVTYTSPVIAGQSNTIIGNFSFVNQPTNVTLWYNGSYTTPSVNTDGVNYIFTSTVNAPVFSTDTNISFYYIFTANSVTSNSLIRNQTIQNVNLSTNCGAGTYLFMNITNYDEETLINMTGTVEYTVDLSNNNQNLYTINGSYTGSNIVICSNKNISATGAVFSLQLRYYATSYLYETYNIVNSPTSNLPLAINLYFLNNTLGNKFNIYYTDFSYIKHPSAIIQIQRQYLSTNSYNTVEVPIIDSSGDSTGSFNTNNIRYKIIVIENGQVIDTFNDVYPVCQSVVLGTCDLNLRGSQTATTETDGDFSYTLVQGVNALTLTYVIPSGIPKTVTFATNQNSRFLTDISTCNSSIFASGGTITCNYNDTVGDSIIETKISINNVPELYGQVLVSEDLSQYYLGNNYFLAFLYILTLALIYISSATMMILSGGLGLLFLGFIFLIKGFSFSTVIAVIGWLLVAIFMIIYKISSREDKT